MGGGTISFVPEALSGMGWLHTKNVHAQHACDHNRFGSIPAMEQKKKGTGERGEKKENRNIYIQFASTPKALQNISECKACASLRVRLHVRARATN